MNSSIVSTASSTGVDELAQTGAKGTVPLNSNASKIKSVGSSEQSEDKSKCGHTDMEFFTTQEALQEALEEVGIQLPHYKDAFHNSLECPFCRDSGESTQVATEQTVLKSLSGTVKTLPSKGTFASFKCTKTKQGGCGIKVRLPVNLAPHKGAESSFSIDMETQVYRVPVWEKISQQLSSAGYAFLAARGIGKAVANANDVRTAFKHFEVDSQYQRVECVALPFMRNGRVVAVKYRSLEGKRAKKEAKCEKIFYGLDDIMTHTSVEHQPAHLNEHSSDTGQSELPHLLQVYTEPNEGGEVIATADTGDIQNSMQGKIVIVEGEFDKLACNQAGLWNVVSVPDGASGSTRPVQDFMKASHSKEFNYLYNCRNMLQDPRYCAEVCFATDADTPGQFLAVRLAELLQLQCQHSSCKFKFEMKFKLTTWPTSWADHSVYLDAAAVEQRTRDLDAGVIEDDGKRKDANEVLVKDGAHALRAFLGASKPCEPEYMRKAAIAGIRDNEV